jgi:GIY-YIG catalytic domain
MSLTFKSALVDVGIDPTRVRLLRHQDSKADYGKTPYEMFRNDRAAFELYQSHQNSKRRSHLKADYWASFVGTPDLRTLFCGLYASQYVGVGDRDVRQPHREGKIDRAGHYDLYELTSLDALKRYSGVLFIDWGDSPRAWIQRRTDKVITELYREFKEAEFPGFSKFIKRLSEIELIPSEWIAILRNQRGIYLLTCPDTKEQYVGKASGAGGFWGRWQDYIGDGHGGNIRLRSRVSDYQVSILETVGNAMSDAELSALEARWKEKLQSREMGLNAN